MPPTLILRHRKENLKKCSLRGLENDPQFQFFTYPHEELPNLNSYLVLSLNAPILTKEDASFGLLLIDATWRYAAMMMKKIEPTISQEQLRSLPPSFRTAYPRRQEDCPNPDLGLASIEALYVAYHLLGRDPQGLLDHYHWKEEFLLKNKFIKNH